MYPQPAKASDTPASQGQRHPGQPRPATPRGQLGSEGGATLADSDLLAVLIMLSMVARSASSTRWSCCRAVVAARTAGGVLAVSSMATSACTRWASGNPQVTRSFTVCSRWNEASDSGGWYCTRSSMGMLLAGEKFCTPVAAMLIAVLTSWLVPAWMARSSVSDSLTPPAHDSMSVVISWTTPRRSEARSEVDG